MARNTKKKQPEAHKIDCAEVFASLRDLEKLKGIPVDYMVERMKQGMANAYRKDREDRRDVPLTMLLLTSASPACPFRS